jgi:chromosome segregation ATPase
MSGLLPSAWYDESQKHSNIKGEGQSYKRSYGLTSNKIIKRTARRSDDVPTKLASWTRLQRLMPAVEGERQPEILASAADEIERLQAYSDSQEESCAAKDQEIAKLQAERKKLEEEKAAAKASNADLEKRLIASRKLNRSHQAKVEKLEEVGKAYQEHYQAMKEATKQLQSRVSLPE